MGDSSVWVGKRILVTGATGFIGRHLVRRLIGVGAHVCAGTSPLAHSNQRHNLPHTESQSIAFDVRDFDAVKAAVKEVDPEVVFHLAAVGVTDPGVDPMVALTVNTGGAVNVLKALRGTGVKRVMLVGSSYEYGSREAIEALDPCNAYAASKAAAWAFGRMYWQAYGLPVVTLRPFQVYGPGQPHETLIPAAVLAALSGEDFPMTPGEQRRDFVYVGDIVTGMLAAAEASEIEGASLDLGTGTGHTVRHVVERIWQLTDAEGEIRTAALPYRSGKPMHLMADDDRTTRLTGWRATTPLESGLLATICSLRNKR